MEENNILIAEFMDAEVEIWKAHERLGDDTSEDAWYAYFDGNGVAVEELAYGTSWDWLMPVVEKIEQVNELISGHILSTDIDKTYKEVVRFIKQTKTIDMKKILELQEQIKNLENALLQLSKEVTANREFIQRQADLSKKQ